MGQILSAPIVDKETTLGSDNRLVYAASSMQGWRVQMEDAHVHLTSLPEDPDTAFFGVFDGHGGAEVARIAKEFVHKKIAAQPSFADGDFKQALCNGYLEFDQMLLSEHPGRSVTVGCTAVSTLIKDKRIYCANIGDSRAVMSVHGKAVALSEDHKPNNPEEQSRIEAAGGRVFQGRVNGSLALSRAFGDHQYKAESIEAKSQMVTAHPDVTEHDVSDETEFIVLACDGIWDVMSTEEVVDFVRVRLADGHQLAEICEQLLDHCLAPTTANGGVGCDNMTVVIVGFLHDKPFEDLVRRCRVPPEGAAEGAAAAPAAPAAAEGQR